jgi:16S rRNA (adenine1518-N6/adenine1519-N6)-dimethyltransferase
MPRQRLGQHFLADTDWREQIARAIRASRQSLVAIPAEQHESYCWVEIGGGHGEMTELLASTGAPVYTIELDTKLASELQRISKRLPNVKVIRGDILKTDIAALAVSRRVRVYGSLPYYITSPILQHLFASADSLDEIHVVVQFEVAERLAAAPGTRAYGYLSVLTQYFARPELVFEIPRTAFNPPPEVSSALVTLRLPGERAQLSQVDQRRFLNFAKICFSQKRKTLVNNLRAKAKPDSVRAALASLKLRPDARAEQLSIRELATVGQKLALL